MCRGIAKAWQPLIRQEGGRPDEHADRAKRRRYRCSALVQTRRRQCKYDGFRMTNKNSRQIDLRHLRRTDADATQGKGNTIHKCTLQVTDVLYFITCYSSIIHLWQWHDRLPSAEKPDWRVSQAVNKRSNHTSLPAKLTSENHTHLSAGYFLNMDV